MCTETFSGLKRTQGDPSHPMICKLPSVSCRSLVQWMGLGAEDGTYLWMCAPGECNFRINLQLYKRINHNFIRFPIFQLLVIFCQYLSPSYSTRSGGHTIPSCCFCPYPNVLFVSTSSIRPQPATDRLWTEKAKSIRCATNRSGSNLSFPF